MCQANFWRSAQAAAGAETVRAMRGETAVPAEIYYAEAFIKDEVLVDEMRRLAAEDEELRRAMVRLANVSAALKRGTIPAPSADATLERDRTADGGALPHGASRIVDVRIGRDPWRHALTSRTFTIAQPDGAISAIDVECAGGAEQLAWEAGAEWSLPEDWGACTLIIQAPRGTILALYELD